jgi:hypothetical protein
MRRVGILALVVPLLGGCGQESATPEGGPAGPHPEARSLVERGEYDAALADLAGDGDPEALYLMGRAWVGKAGGDRRTLSGGLGPEEMQALDLFQQAVAARPDHARAHLAIGDLLAPYALASPAPAALDAAAGAGTVATVDRVLEAFGAAIQADPADITAVEQLIDFALETDRAPEAAAGFRELTRRDRENPAVLVRYGDFLAGPGEDPAAALGVYGQALIWRPDDKGIHLKIADLHIDAALVRLELDQYAAVEAQLREARKHMVVPGSSQARRLQDAERALAHASGRR